MQVEELFRTCSGSGGLEAGWRTSETRKNTPSMWENSDTCNDNDKW